MRLHLKEVIRNNKGSTMIVVLLVMVVLMILGVVIMNTSVAENKFAKKNEDKVQAYYIARAGAQAMAEYLINGGGQELFNKTSAPNSQIGGGTFTVTVEDDLIANNTINIISVGEYNGTSQTAKIRLSTSGYGPGGVFQYGIAARTRIFLDQQSNNIFISDARLVSAGAIGSIRLGNNIYANRGNGTETLPREYDKDLSFPGIIIPVGCPILTAFAITSVENNPIHRKVEGNLNLNSPLRIGGNGIVHIYVNGNLTMGGSGRIEVVPGAQLYLYITGNSVTFKGSSSANGSIFLYAPNALVNFDNANLIFNGSIVGNEVRLFNRVTIRHDEKLFNNVNLGRTYIGVNYTGYTWFD